MDSSLSLTIPDVDFSDSEDGSDSEVEAQLFSRVDNWAEIEELTSLTTNTQEKVVPKELTKHSTVVASTASNDKEYNNNNNNNNDNDYNEEEQSKTIGRPVAGSQKFAGSIDQALSNFLNKSKEPQHDHGEDHILLQTPKRLQDFKLLCSDLEIPLNLHLPMSPMATAGTSRPVRQQKHFEKPSESRPNTSNSTTSAARIMLGPKPATVHLDVRNHRRDRKEDEMGVDADQKNTTSAAGQRLLSLRLGNATVSSDSESSDEDDGDNDDWLASRKTFKGNLTTTERRDESHKHIVTEASTRKSATQPEPTLGKFPSRPGVVRLSRSAARLSPPRPSKPLGSQTTTKVSTLEDLTPERQSDGDVGSTDKETVKQEPETQVASNVSDATSTEPLSKSAAPQSILKSNPSSSDKSTQSVSASRVHFRLGAHDLQLEQEAADAEAKRIKVYKSRIASLKPKCIPIFDGKATFTKPVKGQLSDGGLNARTYVIQMSMDRSYNGDALLVFAWLCSLTKGSGISDSEEHPLTVLSLYQSAVRGSPVLITVVKACSNIGDFEEFLSRTPVSSVVPLKDASARPLGEIFKIVRSGAKDVRKFMSSSPSFHWNHISSVRKPSDTTTSVDTPDVCLAVIPAETMKKLEVVARFFESCCVQNFLDICGGRLVYVPPAVAQSLLSARLNAQEIDLLVAQEESEENSQFVPMLIVAVSGSKVIEKLQAAVGPQDPMIAKQTDPRSLRAVFGKSRSDLLLNLTRSTQSEHIAEDLAYWFGGRLASQSPVMIGAGSSKTHPLLTAYSREVAALVLSRHFPYRLLSTAIHVCQQAGYRITHLARVRISKSEAEQLGLSDRFISPKPSFFECDRSLVIGLEKQNAWRHLVILIDALTNCLSEPDNATVDDVARLSATEIVKLGSVGQYPSRAACEKMIAHAPRKFLSTPNLPQVVVVTFTGAAYDRVGEVLLSMLKMSEAHLAGIKRTGSLQRYQAKEISPHEVGHPLWRSSLVELEKGPCVIAVLHGLNIRQRVKSLLVPGCMCSQTSEIAYRQMATFFFEGELCTSKSLFHPYLPLPTAGFITSMAMGPQEISTAAVVGSSAARYIARYLRRINMVGFGLSSMELTSLNETVAENLVEQNFPKSQPEERASIVQKLVSGPAWVLKLTKYRAVKEWLDVIAAIKAEKSAKAGTLDIALGSVSFDQAVVDCDRLFPTPQQMTGDGDPLVSEKRMYSCSPKGSMQEIICIVFLPSLVTSNQQGHRSFVHIVDYILGKGFVCVAGRMVKLSESQASRYGRIGYRRQADIDKLSRSPSLVLALSRDNAVTCGKTILCPQFERSSLTDEWDQSLLASQSLKQAEEEVCFFFDKLHDIASHSIQHK